MPFRQDSRTVILRAKAFGQGMLVRAIKSKDLLCIPLTNIPQNDAFLRRFFTTDFLAWRSRNQKDL